MSNSAINALMNNKLFITFLKIILRSLLNSKQDDPMPLQCTMGKIVIFWVFSHFFQSIKNVF